MFMPTLFEGNLFDNLFDNAGRTMGGVFSDASDMMRTDIRENALGYSLLIELPGVKREDVRAELKNGYLTVSATVNNEEKQEENESDTEKFRIIRRERYSGEFARSFYVGRAVTEEDITAKLEDGILTVGIPKKQALPKDDARTISIA